jgi:hypothetical protein
MFKKLNEHIEIQKIRKIQDKDLKFLESQEFEILSILEEIEEVVRGGLSDGMTIDRIAEKHGVSVDAINIQVEKGKKIEMEHTNNSKEAEKVAMDHLVEFPDYYDHLEKMEKKAKEELKESFNAYLEILREESMPENPEYGLPDLKKFPLYDKSHLLAAIKFFNWVSPKDESRLAHAIIAKMKEHGLRQSNVGEKNRLKTYVLKTNLPE